MKKLLLVITSLMMLMGFVACSNATNEDTDVNWSEGKEICLTITLPGKAVRKIEYYSESDACYYVVKLLNGTTEIDSVTGNPGESVTLKTTVEGTYTVEVKAYDKDDNIIAKGTETVTLSFENIAPTVTVTLVPEVKSNNPDEINLGVDIIWGTNGCVPNKMIKISGTEGIPDFYISNTELTYAKWYEVYQWAINNGYVFQNLGLEEYDYNIDTYENCFGAIPKGLLLPVSDVSWRDAIIWCNAASQKEGLQPVYYLEGTVDFSDTTKIVKIAERYCKNEFESGGMCGSNNDNPYEAGLGVGRADKCVVNSGANGYRLPTEVEWTYAAKGGKDYIYSGSNNIEEVAWYGGNSDDKKHEVGTKKANDYGLYDMSGNVFEWCFDKETETFLYNWRLGGGLCCGDPRYCAIDNREICNASYEACPIMGIRVVRSIF